MKTINQAVSQYYELPEERVIVQYYDENGSSQQKIVSYSELTTEQKATFDAYKVLCETLMNG